MGSSPRFLAFLLAPLAVACATAPPPAPPPPPPRETAVVEKPGPAPAPASADWKVVSDEVVPFGKGLMPSNVAFSGQGDRIAFAAWVRQSKRDNRPGEILIVPMARPKDIERLPVTGDTDNGLMHLAWSHDGKSIAYSTGHDIRLLDVATRQSQVLVAWKGTASRTVKSLTFSPDDRRLATLVTRTTGVRFAVIIVKVKSGDTQEFPVADQTVELAGWAAGESVMLVEWDRKPGSDAKKRIGALDLETGKREKWALPRGLDAASASKTGGVVAIDGEGVVWELEEGRWTRRFAIPHHLQGPPLGDARNTIWFDGVGIAPDGKAAVVSEVEADGTGGSGVVRILKLDRSN